MHIVYITSSPIPSRTAYSIHVMKMCQAFASNGHRVTLLAPNVLGVESGVSNDYQFYGVKNGFKIEKLPKIFVQTQQNFYSILAVFRAWRLKPDIVYGRVLGACCYSAVLGLSTIYEAHIPVNPTRNFHELLFDRLIHAKGFRRLIVITKALAIHYEQKYNISNQLIQIAPDGADSLNYVAESVIKKNRLQVGYIGHLYSGKGMEIIVKLAELCPWADFNIIGGSEADVAYWRKKCFQLNNISLYGFIPPAETVKHRNSADVLLAPYQRQVAAHGSVKDIGQWMSPLKIFEYMSAGKPILCSDLPVLREVLTHQETALMCDPDNLQEWQVALNQLNNDPALRKRLGEKAKKLFKENYTWQVRAKNVISGL